MYRQLQNSSQNVAPMTSIAQIRNAMPTHTPQLSTSQLPMPYQPASISSTALPNTTPQANQQSANQPTM